ncbi:lytic transglycosylase domain-containing protein [Chengkuizengella axinellae]|uniref:Lytic transglycosylase domain-containing protein n=1 Tax=Chengkuizengella axinellae TaxID=3064388 RepID=A0ABT9IYK8_9BACL|nr:lytic transglycosylase domain-containing protein [Chengkuizengella sp. 2205SS18-9]MDP5274449.1 lytic transglycosylase domain-containing protein [Chengkuizengella sp. 2205SS18-9]
MKILKKKRFLLVLFILCIGILFYNHNWLGKLIYPIKYKDEIQEISSDYNINPLFIAAIIRVESNYKPDLISSKNAMGLMQIMPDTAKWITEVKRSSHLNMETLMDVRVNIDLGTWYLNALYVEFKPYLQDKPTKDQISLLSAAYNAGPGNVKRWLDKEIWDGKYNSVEQIPFGETRHYIARILYYYEKYEAIYKD